MGMNAKDRAIDLLHCRVSDALESARELWFDRKEKAELEGHKIPLFGESAEYIQFVQDWGEELAVMYELGLAAEEVKLSDLRGIF